MKKLLLSFLLIPCLIFCQEEKNYDQIISLSEFYTQLELAESKSTDLILENCIIKGDEEDNLFKSNKNKNHILDNDSNKINLSLINCKTESLIELSKYRFNDLVIRSSKLKGLRMDSCEITNLYVGGSELIDSNIGGVYVINSTICNIEINYSKFNKRLYFGANIIGRIFINQSEFLEFDSQNLLLASNTFTSPEDSYWYNNHLRIYSDEPWLAYYSEPKVTFINDSIVSHRESNVEIYNSNFNGIIYLTNNSFNDSVNNNIKLLDHNLIQPPNYTVDSAEACYMSQWHIGRKSSYEQMTPYCIDKNLAVKIHINSFKNNFNIRYSSFEEIRFENMNIYDMLVADNKINRVSSSNVACSGFVDFSENIIPSGSSVDFDVFTENSIICVNTLIPNKYDYYSGNSNIEVAKSDSTINQLRFNEEKNGLYKKLISSYLKLIDLTKSGGDEASYNLLIRKMRDVQTGRKKEIYLNSGAIDDYFNWRGNQFLKWFCEYGLSPFKGLSNCFKAIVLFAFIYFFFYSDWDKINRLFLVNKVSAAISYFSSNKKIEDFYFDNHTDEVVTFDEFKNTLQKNKHKIPGLFVHISKPLYQVSYIRQKMIRFMYKKLEFMAGRTWDDLDFKSKYIIGTLTLIATFSYIVYLIIVRVINSLFLSINTFSTLGFGQIPVKGFIRYVTILEGFLGWFLLSVFIVSLLNQMLQV